ncbi:hypothetical protein EGW08_006889 [Elysia chlorotica]|uniref:Uncharacterized protein n=1 Tax=Elysia chlorotica TaxID=188477 RepID=A0A3S1A8H7_ELYCH|nr:hypothetical protein EGW08_006889 [Elysia chlorotica]
MGVMSKASKGNRLPERPKPPAWEDIDADVSAASKDDVVFSVGRANLPNVSAHVPREKNSQANNSTAESSDLDLSHNDPEEVQASYENVLRLIASYEDLDSVPTSVREQYSNLQVMGQDVLGSISQLRELARSVARDSQAHRSTQAEEGHSVKGKARQKKKK